MTLAARRPADLSIQQLRAFCTVYQLQGYGAAARSLGLSVPTVWEQVRAVEARYGAVLFQRRGRSMQPTHAADVLNNLLQPLLNGLDSTFDHFRELKQDVPISLTLVVGVRMMLEELGPALQQFRQAHPHVTLRLLHGDSKVARQRILDNEADLGLTLEPGPDFVLGPLAYERAYELEFLAVFPNRHPLAKGKTLRLRQLVDYPLVAGHRETFGRVVLEQALHRENLLDRMQVAVETDNSAFTVACVRAGLGVGVMAGLANGSLTQKLQTRSLSSSMGKGHIGFLWKRGRQLTPAMTDLMRRISGTK